MNQQCDEPRSKLAFRKFHETAESKREKKKSRDRKIGAQQWTLAEGWICERYFIKFSAPPLCNVTDARKHSSSSFMGDSDWSWAKSQDPTIYGTSLRTTYGYDSFLFIRKVEDVYCTLRVPLSRMNPDFMRWVYACVVHESGPSMVFVKFYLPFVWCHSAMLLFHFAESLIFGQFVYLVCNGS